MSKKRGEPMEEDDYLSDCPLPIVNNNHVKNKKSKSSCKFLVIYIMSTKYQIMWNQCLFW